MPIFGKTEKAELVVENTKLFILLDFKDYPEKLFKQDMQFFYMLNYDGAKAAKKHLAEKSPAQKALVPKRYTKRFNAIKQYDFFFRPRVHKEIRKGVTYQGLYDDFCKTCLRFVSQQIQSLVSTHFWPIIRAHNSFTFKFIIEDSMATDYQAYHLETKSSYDTMYLKIGGPLLLGRVYGPWLYIKRFDKSYLERTFSHELEHQVQAMKGFYIREYAERKKLMEKIKQERLKHEREKLAAIGQDITKQKLQKSHGLSESALVLHEIFCNLYTEGLAQFVNLRRSQKIIIDTKKLEKYRQLLMGIAQAKTRSAAEKIWNEEFCPDSGSGEYYLGFLMCFFIGLGVLKQRLGVKGVRVVCPDKKEIAFEELEKYIQEKQPVQQPVHLGQLDDDAFNQTYSLLGEIRHHRQFIKIFTRACDELGFKQQLRIIDTEFFNQLNKASLKD